MALLSNKFIIPGVNHFITIRQIKNLENEGLKFDTNEDNIYITEKIYCTNIIKMLRLVIQIMIFSYYVGCYWYLFCFMSIGLVHHHENEELYMESENDSFIFHRDSWDLVNQPHLRQVLVSMYFAFTTLSTIGLGDYYPVSNTERLVGSFVILIGVAMFSYILSELLNSFILIKNIEKPFGDEINLDRFFTTLKGFNRGRPIDKNIQ